ncbi:MAG: cysteine hydrolase [Thalassobius sp.]|nr:cysteine hydrolase [Thalassovita sp.]
MRALLIIDMQQVSFTPETPRFEAEEVVERINLIADQFRKENELVIFIQHDGTKEGECIPGTDEWQLLPSLKISSSDRLVHKTANDAFYRTELKEILELNKVDELVITGCATDFCVDATVKSALVNDYNITVIGNAHTTADRGEFTSASLVKYYNWLWQCMSPTEGKIEVITHSELLEKYDIA